MKRTGIIDRIRAAGLMLTGKGLNQHELAHFFGRGRSADRPTRSYSQVVAVFACVRARAHATAGMPLMVSTLDDQVLESGPVVEITEQPNPRMTRRAFWEAVSSIMDLFGSVFWVFELDTLGRPIEVVPVAPIQMKAITDRMTGEVRAWKYRPAGAMAGHEITLPLEQVHQVIDPDFENPHDPLQGLSPRKAVQLAISQYYKSDLANEASLDNGVEPGGVFTMDGAPGADQLADTKQQLAERSGVRNRRRHMVLYGGMKWQTLGMSFKDAEFPELKRLARTDICSAFNVPPSIAGYYENDNRAHADAADRMFWINTIVPRAERLAEEWDCAVLSKWEADRSLRSAEARQLPASHRQRCCPNYRAATRAGKRRGAALFAWFDSSGVPAVLRASLEVTEQAQRWWQMGTPLNDLYRAFDVPLPDVPHGDRGMKPIGLEPYGTDTLDTIDDPDGSDPETGLMPEGQQSGVKPPAAAKGSGEASGDDEVIRATEGTRARLWALWRKSWEPLETAARGRVRSHFYDLRSETLANLDRVASQITPPPPESGGNGAKGMVRFYPEHKRDIIGQVLFNLERAGDGLVAKMNPLIRMGHLLGGEQSMKEAAEAQGKDQADPFNIEDPNLTRLLGERDIRLRDVDANLRSRLASKLAKAIDERKTVNEIADAIKEEFGFARKRAAVIARTEIGGAVEESRHAGRRQAGVPLKSWLHSRKETGRPTHAATERETTRSPIPNDTNFTITGTSATCPHPRATGDPGHDVNCGCTCLSRYPGDTIKSVLDRYTRSGFLTYEQLSKRITQPSNAKDGPTCPDAQTPSLT